MSLNNMIEKEFPVINVSSLEEFHKAMRILFEKAKPEYLRKGVEIKYKGPLESGLPGELYMNIKTK